MPDSDSSLTLGSAVKQTLEKEFCCEFILVTNVCGCEWVLYPAEKGHFINIAEASLKKGILRLDGCCFCDAKSDLEFNCPEELVLRIDEYFERLDEPEIRNKLRPAFPSILEEIETFEKMLAKENRVHHTDINAERGGFKMPYAEVEAGKATASWLTENIDALSHLGENFQEWYERRERRKKGNLQRFDRRVAQAECTHVVKIMREEGIECESSAGSWFSVDDPSVVWVVGPSFDFDKRMGTKSFLFSVFKSDGVINVRSKWLFDVFREFDSLYPKILERADPVQVFLDGLNFSDETVRSRYAGDIPYIAKFYEKLQFLIGWSNSRNSAQLTLNNDQGVLDVRAGLRGKARRYERIRDNIHAIGDLMGELEKWVPENRPDGRPFQFRGH
jgi:hypothetical protein